MKDKSRKGINISRRNILPLIGSGLLVPFLGFSNTSNEKENNIQDTDEYQTLLRPDGTAVKVKVSAIKRSKIIKKNISNGSFLNWLNKKF
jgi:hypothetical protein